MKNYESLADVLADLKKRGYEADFATETVCLYCGDLDIRLDPEDFHVDEIYRFDGNPGPDNNAVVYAISSSFGVSGVLVDAFGAYGENLNVEMVKKLQQVHSIIN